MTRINLVDPSELIDKHLLAEYRELPRVFSLIRSYDASGRLSAIPNQYTLGKGHVRFFFNKGQFLADRQLKLIAEMRLRGFNPRFNNVDSLTQDLPGDLMGDYTPDDRSIKINQDRISLRIRTMGSATELKTYMSVEAYKRIKPHFAQKDWEIVAFTSKRIVLRVENENIEFDRNTGKIVQKISLATKKG